MYVSRLGIRHSILSHGMFAVVVYSLEITLYYRSHTRDRHPVKIALHQSNLLLDVNSSTPKTQALVMVQKFRWGIIHKRMAQ